MTWMFSKALMNSLCSQESAAESLPVSNSESEPSVQLSVMPTQHKFWHNDKMMDHSNLSRFGLTLQLLTESRGEELLTLYRADFPVRTLVLQEKAQGSKAKEADSGQRWSELLAKYDPVSFLWKTCQLSLLEDLELSLETWPKWGMTRNGVAYQRQKLEPITKESAFGFYVPTPTASDVNMWPTPSANEDAAGTPNGNMQRMLGNCKEIRGETKEEWEKGSLSADWTEWLMGFPVGWSDLKAIPGVALSWDREPEGLPRVVEKQEYRALRLKGIGNAQVPQCAAAAFVQLLERINE